jgi:hypothetical protein
MNLVRRCELNEIKEERERDREIERKKKKPK